MTVLAVGIAAPVIAGEDAPFVGGGDAEDPAASVDRQAPQVTETPTAEPTAESTVKAWDYEPRVLVRSSHIKAKPKPDPEVLRARAEAKAEKAAAKKAASAPMAFRIGTFNVLGSQHTGPGGDRGNYASASVRSAKAAGVIAKHGVDILGTQELQDDQLRDLQNRTGMAAYPGFAWGDKETDNSVFWDPGVFELVSGDQFTITFMGRPRPQPIVRLRHLATGRELYVVNTHPSAHEGQYAVERRNGQNTLVGVVRDLKSTGLPVLVTGDMNDREAFYCNVVPTAGLTAPNGGSYANGCQPPPSPIPVDWVVGSGAAWSDYWRDTSTTEQKISDHFFISAHATID